MCTTIVLFLNHKNEIDSSKRRLQIYSIFTKFATCQENTWIHSNSLQAGSTQVYKQVKRDYSLSHSEVYKTECGGFSKLLEVQADFFLMFRKKEWQTMHHCLQHWISRLYNFIMLYNSVPVHLALISTGVFSCQQHHKFILTSCDLQQLSYSC